MSGTKDQELGLTVTKKNSAEWFTQVVRKAELADYGPISGFMVFQPYGYAIWELLSSRFDRYLKKDGVKNTYFPLLIPESFLEKEKDIVEGFEPQVAWVTHGGNEKLEERLAVRPTSESVICHYFSKWVRSHRDLPLRINQWCNIVRWESKTNLFLRTREFLWQEGHTCHATKEGADKEALRRLEQYARLFEEVMAIPVIKGVKPDHDKFPGALYTTAVETLMPDNRSLQGATSHNLGQNFSKAFAIKYTDEKGAKKYVWNTSWGLATRVLGALVLVHGDDKGLVLPPEVAPIQVIIVPIYSEENKAKVLRAAKALKRKLSRLRVEIDDDDTKTPGFKFSKWELKGVPLRIEFGTKELKDKKISVVRRDTQEKITIRTNFSKELLGLLRQIQVDMLTKHERFLNKRFLKASNFSELRDNIGKGYVMINWCGSESCAEKIKEELQAEIVLIPLSKIEEIGKKAKTKAKTKTKAKEKCAVCRKPAFTVGYVAKKY